MLAVLDEKWKDHLYDLDQLRNAIQYRAYGQKDPLVEYKKEAFEMFEDLMRDVQATFTERFLKIQVIGRAAAATGSPTGRVRWASAARAPPPRAAGQAGTAEPAPTSCSRLRAKGGGGADPDSRCPRSAVNQSWADAFLHRSGS